MAKSTTARRKSKRWSTISGCRSKRAKLFCSLSSPKFFTAMSRSKNWSLESLKPAGKFALVLVTAPDVPAARKLAKAALQARLIACANLIPKIESHYWWQGKIESGAEVLLLLKTTTARLVALATMILANDLLSP